jgi:hypothetical protein
MWSTSSAAMTARKNGVRQVFLVNERGDERLICGTAECLRDAGDHRQRQDVPDANGVEVHERGQDERGGHLNALRHHQQLPPIAAVGDHSADQGEEQDGGLAQERIEAEVEGRR